MALTKQLDKSNWSLIFERPKTVEREEKGRRRRRGRGREEEEKRRRKEHQKGNIKFSRDTCFGVVWNNL